MALLDMFRSKVFNSNPQIRITELKKISDANQDLFANIIKKDKNDEVRKIAIQRLSSWEGIHWAAENETSEENKALANKKLGEIAFKEARDLTNVEEAKSWFQRLNQSKHIQELAKSANLKEIRLLAISKIDKENFLTDLVLQESDIEIAQAAIEKITKPSSIQKIYQNAKTSEIRSLVKDQVVTNKQEEPKTVISQDFDLAKRKVIITKLEAFDKRSQVLNFSSEFESLTDEWKSLSSTASDDENQLIREISERYQAKKSVELEEQKKSIAMQQKMIAVESEVNNFLASLKEYSDLYAATDEGKSQLQEHLANWSQIQERYADISIPTKLTDLVNQSLNNIREIQQKLENQALNQEQQAERRTDIINQLIALADKTEHTLSDTKHLKKILKNWNSLGELPEGSEEIQSQFNTLESRVTKTIQSLENQAKAELENKTNELKAIIESVRQIQIGDEDLNGKIRQANIAWKEAIGDDKMKFEELYKEFRDVQSPFAEVRQWEQWHNEKEKLQLVEEAQKLKEITDEEEIYNSIRSLQERWKKSGPIPQNKHQELWEQFKAANDENYARCTTIIEKLKQQKQENLQKKLNIVEEAKQLVSNITNWKTAATQLRDLQDKWKDVGPISREEQQSVWVEFKSHIDSFYSQRKEFFKGQDSSRQENLVLKEKLCIKAEELAQSDDWAETSKALIDLQKEWKTIGPVPREESDKIWTRLRAACDGFFEKKKSHFDQLDADRAGNLDIKNEIISELNETLNKLPEDIFEYLSAIRQKWNDAGPVPRKDSDKIWELFGDAQDKLIDAGLERDPKFAQKIQNDIEAKKKLLERAKTVADSSEWSGTAEVLKEMQQEWKELNRIGSQEKELWTEFREICDSFFDRRKDQYEIMEQTRINNLAAKKTLLAQAQELAKKDPSAEVQREIKHLRQQWKEIGHVPKKYSDKIWNDFNQACDSCFPQQED